MSKHAALPGFRDFYPEELARRTQIFDVWRDVARRWGFEEYDGPPLEALELYIEKSGPEIVNQLFNFTDKGGRDVALRPEMTPTIVRMLGARVKGMPRPIRWFSLPQLFRYEKQQRGRLREHFQLNMDIIGEDSVLADADLLCAALDVLRSLGLAASDVVARYSDRRLLHLALIRLGVPEESLPVAYNVIDKVERDPREVCLQRLQAIGLTPERAAEALGLTDLTRETFTAKYGDDPALQPVLEQLARYDAALRALGFGDFVQFDMKIVRGLAYYTGIVFEIFDRRGELRAICGGGRYDRLFSSLTGIDVPALGFGFGDVVLGELLKDRGLDAKYQRKVDASVLAAEAGVTTEDVLSVVAALRADGLSAVFPYREGNLGKALKAAASSGSREAVLVGSGFLQDAPKPARERRVVVRDLSQGTQSEMTIETYLRERRRG